MTDPLTKAELHQRVAALLNTAGTGQAVTRALSSSERSWADRATIGALRAGRAHHRYTVELDDRDVATWLAQIETAQVH